LLPAYLYQKAEQKLCAAVNFSHSPCNSKIIIIIIIICDDDNNNNNIKGDARAGGAEGEGNAVTGTIQVFTTRRTEN